MKYELWYSESDSSYAFFASGHKDRAGCFEPDAKMIWTVEADTWDEAKRKKDAFLGWADHSKE